jgi:hypothetical protein
MSQRRPDDARADLVARTRATIRDEMDDRSGLTRSALLDQLQRFLKTKKKIIVTKDGEISDYLDVDDTPAQMRAWEHAMTLRQEFPSRSMTVDHTLNVESLGKLVGDIAALARGGELTITDMHTIAGLPRLTAGPDVLDATGVSDDSADATLP